MFYAKEFIGVMVFVLVWLGICLIRNKSDNIPYDMYPWYRIKTAALCLGCTALGVIVAVIGYTMHMLWPDTLLDALSIPVVVAGGGYAIISAFVFVVTPFVHAHELM